MFLQCRKCSNALRQQRAYLSYSALRQKKENTRIHVHNAPPTNIDRDWVGPPDHNSNIRPIKFAIDKNETDNEKYYRLKHQEVLQWNQDHWAEHNRKFFKSKEEFVKNKLKEKKEKDGLKADSKLSPEEMSEFYKEFLDKHYSMHIQYNKEWYKRNLSLLWPAFLAFKDRWKRRRSKN